MILELFTSLTDMLQGSPSMSLAASFLWGVISVILSPCHLAGIPLIIGFINGRKNITTGRAAFLSTTFSIGVLITIALIGIITGLAGRLLGDLGPGVNLAVSLLLIIMGLHLMGIIPLPFIQNGRSTPAVTGSGGLAALLLGLSFGAVLGPCTFAYMAPLIGISISVAGENPALAVLLVVAYALGHSSVLIFAGTSAELVQRFLNWNEKSSMPVIIKKICGLLVTVAGIYMSYKAVKALV